jgi:hypothetical protein
MCPSRLRDEDPDYKNIRFWMQVALLRTETQPPQSLLPAAKNLFVSVSLKEPTLSATRPTTALPKTAKVGQTTCGLVSDRRSPKDTQAAV